MSLSSIALNRFGLGARSSDDIVGDPRRWLLDQFGRYESRPAAIASAPTSASVAGQLVDFYDRQRDLRQELGPQKQFQA